MKLKLNKLWLLILLPVSYLIIVFARLSSSGTEKYYSLGFYRLWSSIFTFLTGWIPFSLAEVLICLVIIWAVWYTLNKIYTAIKFKEKRVSSIKQWASTAAAILSVLVFIFAVNSAPNYSRLSFTYYSGLEIRQSSQDELAELCTELVGQANGLAGKVKRDNSGEMTLGRSIYKVAKEVRSAYKKLSQKYPVLSAGGNTTPKPVTFSEMMSYARATGVFSAYTYEANINMHTNDFTIPATMCHELTHVAGFMREDEANYIAYIACRESGNDDLNYSGTMLALAYTSNALSAENKETWKKVMSQLDDRAWSDFDKNSDYWRKYETSFGTFSEKINDTYLKANNQQDGIKSYGRMLDLLLSEYRQRKGIK